MYGLSLYTMTEIRLVMFHFSVVRIKQKRAAAFLVRLARSAHLNDSLFGACASDKRSCLSVFPSVRTYQVRFQRTDFLESAFFIIKPTDALISQIYFG